MSNQVTSWKSSLKEAHTKFKAINPEKAQSELGFAMQIFQNSDALQRCDTQSIMNAVVNVARTSVTLNPVMRLAYLVPRKGKCVLDFSYMGLVAMLRDNNCIKSISAHIVYEDEEFDYDVAYNKISHKPRFAKTEEEHKSRGRIGCYSRATLPNGEVVFEFMPMWEVEKVKRLSEGSGSKYSAWQTWEEEMIKKVVIKRHFKMLISGNPSEALATALQVENENNALMGGFGTPNANLTTEKRPSLMSAFNEDTQYTNQLSFLEQEVEELNTEAIANPIPVNNAMNLTDDMIEQILAEEERKSKIDDLLEQERKIAEEVSNLEEKDFYDEDIDELLEEGKTKEINDTIELFPTEEETEGEDMGWFPTPKND